MLNACYTWDLGLEVLQLSNCSLEYVKTWRANNIFWERLPLHNCQREKGVLVVVLCRVQLAEGQRMALPVDARVWLDIVWGRHCDYLIHDLVKESIRTPLL